MSGSVRQWRKWVLLILLGGVLVAIAGIFYQYRSLNIAYAKRLADYRTAYSEQIANLVAGPASPESSADIHAYIAGKTLDQMLKVLVGPKFPLSDKLALEIGALDFRVEEGAPLFSFTGRLHFQDSSGTSIEVRGAATLAPPVSENGGFTTRLHIIALDPTLTTSRTKLALKGIFGDLVKAIGQEQLDKLPSFSLPIRQEFTIPVKGSEQAINFKTRPPENDTLHGKLALSGFALQASLQLQHAHFLPDGLHLFLQEGAGPPPPAENPAWKAMSNDERLKTLCDPSVSYFTRIRLEMVNRLISRITSLPKENRTVTFKSTSLDGNLYYEGHDVRGPFKVFLGRAEKKAYLEHPDSAGAQLEVVGLKLEPRAGALVGLKLKAALKGRVQLHWHFDPGPGGGVGGNVGVEIPSKEYELAGSVHLVPTPNPALEARLDGPDSIKINASVLLGQLGQIGMDQTVPLPKTPLFSAPVPNGLQETVRVKFGPTVIQRKLAASNITITQAQEMLIVACNVSLEEVLGPP